MYACVVSSKVFNPNSTFGSTLPYDPVALTFELSIAISSSNESTVYQLAFEVNTMSTVVYVSERPAKSMNTIRLKTVACTYVWKH